MPTDSAQPTALDPQAVMLAKAIRQTESGGNFTVNGKSGEYGAYQYTQGTWDKDAADAGVQVPLHFATPEQQNQVAYTKIKKLKDAGYNVGQIASIWNSGKPDAYIDPTYKGKNSSGAQYDVPAYAKSVATAYQTLKVGGQVAADPENPSSTANTTPVEPAKQMTTAGTDISPENTAKAWKGLTTPVEPTFPANQEGGAGSIIPNIARAFGNIPSDIASTVQGIGSLIPAVANRGILGTEMDMAKGLFDTGKKAVKSAIENPAGAVSDLAALPINHPLLIPSLMMGGGETNLAKGSDLISKVASPVTKAAAAMKPDATKILADQFRKTANKYVGAGETLADAEKVGSNPLEVLSSYGDRTIPQLADGKITAENVREIQDFLHQKIGELSSVKNDAVFLNENKVPFKDFKQYVLDTADAERVKQGWSIHKTQQVQAQLEKYLSTYEKSYETHPLTKEGGLPIHEIDKIKTDETGLSTSYEGKGGDKFEYDAHGVIGAAARNLVETFTDDAPTRELNKLIQSHYDAAKLVDKLIGKAPHGGRFTKAFDKFGGIVSGTIAGTSVGHPFIGMAAGRLSGDVLNSILTNNFISSPLKRLLVRGAGIKDPAALKQMLDYIDKNSPHISELGEQTPPPASLLPTPKPDPSSPTKGI